MTMMEFFGCGMLAFGPAVAMFVFTIARDPLRIIVFVASAFFWLISLLISAAWWKVVIPLQDYIAFGLVFSVVFQEIFRLLFFLLLKKAEEGLAKVWQDQDEGGPVSLVSNKGLMAYVSGFGFGMISGAFSLINVLADMTGPGTVGIRGNSLNFFITSSLLTLCFILLHTCWGIVYFDGLRRKRYYQPVAVFLSHMLISCLTLLNRGSVPMYVASLLPAYLMLVGMATWAFIVLGGTCQSIRTALTPSTTSYNL